MPLTEDQIEMINKIITQRLNNIGIWDETKENLESSRSNNKLINEIRLSRDERQGLLRRSFMDIMSSISGNLLWVILTAVVVWALQFLTTGRK